MIKIVGRIKGRPLMLCTFMKAESSSSFDIEEISEEHTFLVMLLADLTQAEVK